MFFMSACVGIGKKETHTPEWHNEITLLRAIEDGHIDEVKRLLAEGVDVNTPLLIDGSQALICAFCGADEPIEMIDILLAAGVDVNATGGSFETALIVAARRGSIDIVRKLISAGADVNASPEAGYGTALMAAIGQDSHTSKEDKARYTAIAKELLNAGTDVNIQNRSKQTALSYAVFSGNVDEVIMLLEAGADPNIRDDFDNTILSTAINWGGGKASIVEKLIAFGADVNASNECGATELMEAVSNTTDTEDSIAIVKALLMAGADVNAKYMHGQTALDFADRDEIRPEIVRMLREAGAIGRDEVEK